MTKLIGLTGSIGMGKSTTAKMFADHGIPVWDADAAVHRLYTGPAVEPIRAAFPTVIVDGEVCRDQLKRLIDADPLVLSRLEQIVHPLVAQDRTDFIADASADLLLFDIPLLFETQADHWLDGVITVSVPPEIQRERVLARPGMTVERLDDILARQLPDAEKRRRADWVIDTSTLDGARAQVAEIVKELTDA